MCEVLQESLVYSEHAGRTDVEIEDVRMAIKSQLRRAFIQPPSREVRAEAPLRVAGSPSNCSILNCSFSSIWPHAATGCPFPYLTIMWASAYRPTNTPSWEPAIASRRRAAPCRQCRASVVPALVAAAAICPWGREMLGL